jgi:hypothetical protein
MISTVTLTFDLTYRNPLTGALEPRGIVTDSTNYSGPGGLGIDLLISEAKGLGQITFNGDMIVDLNTIEDPMINLQDWSLDPLNAGITPFYAFSLTLDSNGNVANGVYEFTYSLRLINEFETEIDAATSNSLELTGYEYLANFLEAGNSINNGAQSTQVVSTSFEDPTLTINTTNIASPGAWEFLAFDITNVQLNAVYTYSGCVQSAATVNFSYDCEVGTNGTWAVANSTVLDGQTITSLSATINYPAWTSLTPTFNSQIVTSTLPYSNNVLATGTFSVSLSQVIQRVQADGLILQYISSGVQEFVVSCAGSLCGLIPCMENLRNAHALELQRNRISKYQVFVDNVLLYYTEAQNYRSCGDIEKYRKTLALIEAQLDASGCECECCDSDTYQWVNNNAASTIDTLINAIQFRLFSLNPAGPGSPLSTNDETQGVQVGALWQNVDTQIIYICTDNEPSNAIWEEYYAPGVLPTASEIPADAGVILTSELVQGQLTQIDTLAVFDGISGLNKVGNDVRLGGTLDATTVINADNNVFEIISDNEPLSVRAGDGTCLLAARAQTANTGVGQNLILETTSTSGNGANGLGSSIFFTAAPASSPGAFPLSTIQSFWANAATRDSRLTISTVDNGVENIGVTLNENSLVTLNAYGAGTFAGLVQAAYDLSVDSSGQIIEVPAVFTYAGRTRFSAGAIQISEFGNTTGATISISNSGVGVYTLTSSSAIFATNTVAFVQLQGAPGFTTAVVTNSSTITIRTYSAAGVLDDAVIASGSFIKIEIYS